MSPSDESAIGLFPLGIVLLPGEVVPLHIFEPRYQRLLADLEEQGGEFIIALLDDDGLREIACTAMLAEVVERLDDGGANVLVEGRRRVRLLDVRQPDDPEEEYMRATVEDVPDESSGALASLEDEVLGGFRRMLVLMEVETPRVPSGEGPLAYRLAAAVDFGTALKQQLLESTDERERLSTLNTVMAALIPRLELRREREEAIRGNGKGY